MAAQLYANTKLAECLFEVLGECVSEGVISEAVANATLQQLDQSFLAALQDRVSAKADIKAVLGSYKYYDNVWQFYLKDVHFRLNPTGAGSAKKAPEVTCQGARVICVDSKLAGNQQGAT